MTTSEDSDEEGGEGEAEGEATAVAGGSGEDPTFVGEWEGGELTTVVSPPLDGEPAVVSPSLRRAVDEDGEEGRAVGGTSAGTGAGGVS